MTGRIDLDRHLEAYLAIRDALGLTAGTRARLLCSFLDCACGATAPGMPIRAMTAVAWACDHAPSGCGDAGKAHRLIIARGFLTYLSAVVPGTEVPTYGLLAGHRRRRPYIVSDAEIEALTAAAATAPPRGGLRPSMLATLLGLLASTGPRVGKAIRLTMDDVRLDARPAHLCVLESKFLKSRLVPVDPTTAAALADYVRRRHDLGYHALSEIFFVNERGGPLDAGVLGRWFGKLTGKAGLRPIREGARRAWLHSFRHYVAFLTMSGTLGFGPISAAKMFSPWRHSLAPSTRLCREGADREVHHQRSDSSVARARGSSGALHCLVFELDDWARILALLAAAPGSDRRRSTFDIARDGSGFVKVTPLH